MVLVAVWYMGNCLRQEEIALQGLAGLLRWGSA